MMKVRRVLSVIADKSMVGIATTLLRRIKGLHGTSQWEWTDNEAAQSSYHSSTGQRSTPEILLVSGTGRHCGGGEKEGRR